VRPEPKSTRWWPLPTLLILAFISIGTIWVLDAAHRQNKVFLTFLVVILTVLLGVVWLLGFSRLRWRAKGIAVAVGILAVFLGTNLFEFRGFSGDLVPLLKWRWGSEPTVFQSASGQTLNPQIGAMDYPQFLGQNRNGVVPGIRLNLDWDTYPPELVWRRPVGAGWSGFAVVGNAAVTQEQEGDWEKVVCYELDSGEIKWSHRDRARYNSAPAGLGPRATPTIVGDRVYTVGSTGILNCLKFETGDLLWTANIFENGADAPPWGVSTSPLVFKDLVIVSAGGAVAYHSETGEVAWTGHRTRSGYSSPLVTTLGGLEQIVIFNQGLITAHEPASGELLWKQPWAPSSYAECVAQPVPLPDDKLLVSTGYGVGAKLFHISRNQSGRFDVSVLWETIYLKAKFTNIIYYGGYLYGLDDGIFACVNPADGTREWKRGRYGHGQTLLISDVLLVLTESGEVVLIEPDPGGPREHARFSALDGKTWNTPALAGPYLLVRNDREAACYQLPLTTDTE